MKISLFFWLLECEIKKTHLVFFFPLLLPWMQMGQIEPWGFSVPCCREREVWGEYLWETKNSSFLLNKKLNTTQAKVRIPKSHSVYSKNYSETKGVVSIKKEGGSDAGQEMVRWSERCHLSLERVRQRHRCQWTQSPRRLCGAEAALSNISHSLHTQWKEVFYFFNWVHI